MMNKNIFSKSQLELLPVYDEAIKREVNDGLRFMDFRKSLKPDYATEWTPDGGSDDDNKEVFFSWQMASSEALGAVYVSFFADYQAPLKRLYAQATRHTATFPLWGACIKDIGNVCAQSLLEERNAIMFTYKNVFVKAGGSSKLPNGTPLNEALAQWVFDQLKKAPKVAALPDNIDKWEWLMIDDKSDKAADQPKTSDPASVGKGKELPMKTHAEFVKMMLETDDRLPIIKKSIRYDEKVAAEINDGLIFVDLKKSGKPTQLAKWLADDHVGAFCDKDDKGNKKFIFSWEIESSEVNASAIVTFYNDYEQPKKDLLFSTVGSSNAPHPIWAACRKNFGTICTSDAEGTNAQIMFTYKNVLVNTIGFTKLSNDETVAELLAQWVFDQLKKAPKVAALPDNINIKDGNRKVE